MRSLRTKPATGSLYGLKQFFHTLGGLDRDASGFDHHNHQVGKGGQQRGIGDRDDRRGIEDDYIIVSAAVLAK